MEGERDNPSIDVRNWAKKRDERSALWQAGWLSVCLSVSNHPARPPIATRTPAGRLLKHGYREEEVQTTTTIVCLRKETGILATGYDLRFVRTASQAAAQKLIGQLNRTGAANMWKS